MNTTRSTIFQVDAGDNRRKALAKVYKLLLALSQEKDTNPTISKLIVTDTKNEKLTVVEEPAIQ
jgi:hypothetical protein